MFVFVNKICILIHGLCLSRSVYIKSILLVQTHTQFQIHGSELARCYNSKQTVLLHRTESSFEMEKEIRKTCKKNGNRTIQWASRELNNSICMYHIKLIAKRARREKQENVREKPNDRKFGLQPFTHSVCGRRVLNWQ